MFLTKTGVWTHGTGVAPNVPASSEKLRTSIQALNKFGSEYTLGMLELTENHLETVIRDKEECTHG